MRRKFAADYEMYGQLACYNSGQTNSCEGPWFFPSQWDSSTALNRLVPNARADRDWRCSADLSYQSPLETERVYYGLSSENFTSTINALGGVAHFMAILAAGYCTYDEECANMYPNFDMEKMYADYRHYIDTTFLTTLQKALDEDNSLSFCPEGIESWTSMLHIASMTFDGGKEYFGIHNSIWIDEVRAEINGTEQQERAELQAIFMNNARKLEATMLHIVFFDYDESPEPDMKRRDNENEIYPGCDRQKWLLKGSCPGVIPPRSWDLTGTVIPMKDRDSCKYLMADTTLNNA